MSGSYQRQSLELRSPDHASGDDPDGCLRTHLGSSASQRRRQQRIAQQRQDSWFRHSMPPAINRDFESLEHLTPRASDGLDEQLAASVSHSVHSGGSVTLCGPPDHSSIHLNSANSNLGFIDSDTPNTPVTPVSGLQPPASVSTSVAGTLSSRRRSSNRKDSKGSILSRQSGKSRVSVLAQRGLRMTASFLRRKRTEYEAMSQICHPTLLVVEYANAVTVLPRCRPCSPPELKAPPGSQPLWTDPDCMSQTSGMAHRKGTSCCRMCAWLWGLDSEATAFEQ